MASLTVLQFAQFFRDLTVEQLKQGDFEQRAQPPPPLLQAQLGRGGPIKTNFPQNNQHCIVTSNMICRTDQSNAYSMMICIQIIIYISSSHKILIIASA